MLVIVDYRISYEIESNLKALGFIVVKTVEAPFLDEPVNGHPDMVLLPITKSKVIINPQIYSQMAPKLVKEGVQLITGRTVLEATYPLNIAYNALKIEDYLLHKIDHTDPVIVQYLSHSDQSLVNVKQGYTKCASTKIDEHAIITADDGIYQTVKKLGFEALLIRPGYIDLLGYPYGFIGGASGFCDNKVFFTGHLNKHPDKAFIYDFIKSLGYQIVLLSDKPAYDYGTLIFLEGEER